MPGWAKPVAPKRSDHASDDTRQRVGFDADAQGLGGGVEAVTVEVDGRRSVEVDLHGRLVALLDPRVGQVGAVPEPTTHLQALAEGKVRVEHVEAAIVR